MTRLGKSLLVVPALLLALAGCGGTKSTPTVPVDLPVPAPVLLQVTATRPAGTLDSLPDLSWTLTGASGLSLVVRAQGPGASSPGVGFAGVRVASGSIRYLGPDGTWGETEVVYAAITGAAGTIRPTAPLRLEGEWRFDLLVKDATGALQAMAMAPVVLSSKPALRVTLSQRAALAGDAVEGAVVLARGSADRSVKLLAWWQGPGGEVVQLPEVAPLAFDGPAADLRLPLLARRLDGAAPGSWSLVARLFDAATGEPIAYGEQSLQVCATSSPVAGTLRGSGGSPLGGGASLAEVQALSIDRQVRVSSPVGAAGDFSLALDPGAWAVSALVVDAAGLHRVPVQPLQVGCEAPPLLRLDAAPPVSLPARLAGSTPPLALVQVTLPAQPAAPPEQVQIPFFGSQTTFAGEIIGANGLEVGMEVVASRLFSATGHGLSFNTLGTLRGVAQLSALQQAAGVDSTLTDRTLYNMVGGHISAGLTATKVTATTVQITLTIADGRGTMIRRLQRTVTAANAYDGFVAIAQEAAGGSPSLLDAVRAAADFPQNPVLTISAVFGSVMPSSQQTVKVHLQDSQGNTYAGRKVYLQRSSIAFPSDPLVQTDAGGDATFQVQLGVAAREESVLGLYYNRVGKPFKSNPHRYAVQRAQTGQLRFTPAIPVVRPGGSAVLQVASQEVATGAPQAGKPVAFSANLGGARQTATAITDSAGVAGAALAAGAAVGLGQVDAVGSTATPAPPEADHATESLVVSSPAALNLSGPTGTVLPGAQVPLSGSLRLDGLPMPGTTVTLTHAGSGGTLSTSTVPVDDTGSFTATFQPPPSGTGTATVTATVQVEGQPVTMDAGVSWSGQSRGERLVMVGSNVGGQVTLKVSKVEPAATTEVFSAAVPAAVGPPYFGAPFLYQRQQQKLVISAASALDRGWGILGATGPVDLLHPPLPNTIDDPSCVSSNGKYRAHWYGYEYCDPNLPEGSPCTVTRAVVVYDNATGAVLDQLDPRLSGPNGLAGASAVGPAGELLMGELVVSGSPTSITWYLHRPGGATAAIGSFPVGAAAFSASGDKAYIGDPSNLVEVVLATGASRSLPAFGTPAVAAMSWAVELDAILYADSADPEPRQLHRIDLFSGLVTDVGLLPSSPSLSWSLTLVP